nr:uncharacterized protein LOC131785097 isoform X1 [Pocillopora verrucosa]
MASGAKRQRYSVAEALDIIFDDGSEHGGMSSGEESELDRKLENPSEESRRLVLRRLKSPVRIIPQLGSAASAKVRLSRNGHSGYGDRIRRDWSDRGSKQGQILYTKTREGFLVD